MLAVLKIRMTWTKEKPHARGCCLARTVLQACPNRGGGTSLGEGIFLKECDCEQVGSQIFSNYDFAAQRGEKKRKISPPQHLTVVRIEEKVISMIIWD